MGKHVNRRDIKTHCKRGHQFTDENTYLHENKNRERASRNCRICTRDRLRRYRRVNHEKVVAYDKKYYDNNREKIIAYKRKHRLNSFYQITEEDFESMYKSQNGQCAICLIHMEFNSKIHIDHSHKTGKVRGLLCKKCNLALGFIENEEFRKKAIIYLEKNNG